MNSLNSILIAGNLTRDPVVTETTPGKKVCSFSIACNRYYKVEGEQKKETSFFDVETWNGLAANCSTYLEKGKGVRIVGRLKQNRWVNTESGDNMQKVFIVAEHVDFKPVFSN